MASKTIKIEDDVRDVIVRSTVSGKSLTLPPGLDRALYVRVDKVLKALGGAWNRSAGAHLFESDAKTKLADILAGAQVIAHKRNVYQAFYTKPDTADMIAKAARLLPDHLVLEPSAGRGALLNAALRHGATRENMTAIDLDPEAVAALKADGWKDVHHADFLSFRPSKTGKFNRVLMNPPFTNGQDVDHVVHALDFLLSGALLVSVMSNHWTFAQDKRSAAFRTIFEAYEGSQTKIPAGSFENTDIEAQLITIRKL